MEDRKTKILDVFDPILESLVDGETYDRLPPRGPNDPTIASIADNELRALDQDIWGQDEEEPLDESQSERRTTLVEAFSRKEVPMPTEQMLDGINVIGIVGDNKRVLTTSFHLILSRVAIVNFRYTKEYEKPYFYTRMSNASALMVLDNNIFDETYSVHTNNELLHTAQGAPMLDELKKNKDNKPFRFKYNYERTKKAPSSQSLGLAVKFQHALELLSIEDIEPERSGLTVCLKEGALFSNSTELSDIRNGLKKLLAWKNTSKFFIGTSTQVAESRVLITTLSDYPHLIEDYFPNQNILPSTIRSFGTDALLLKKILWPGFRTPLVEYIEPTREGAIADPELQGLKPVTCYYHKRSKPYNFIRIEMPRFMWEADNALAESAIALALWQYELGGNEPLVLKAAREQSDLSHDKSVIEQQMKAAFDKKKLGLIEFLDLK